MIPAAGLAIPAPRHPICHSSKHKGAVLAGFCFGERDRRALAVVRRGPNADQNVGNVGMPQCPKAAAVCQKRNSAPAACGLACICPSSARRPILDLPRLSTQPATLCAREPRSTPCSAEPTRVRLFTWHYISQVDTTCFRSARGRLQDSILSLLTCTPVLTRQYA